MLYQMINQDAPTMRNTYTWTALALSFMWGPAINNWVLQQTEQLYAKCNGDPVNRIGPTYWNDDENIWIEFGQDFCWAFADTALEQRAYGKLTKCAMGNKTINEYVAQFKHLL